MGKCKMQQACVFSPLANPIAVQCHVARSAVWTQQRRRLENMYTLQSGSKMQSWQVTGGDSRECPEERFLKRR